VSDDVGLLYTVGWTWQFDVCGSITKEV